MSRQKKVSKLKTKWKTPLQSTHQLTMVPFCYFLITILTGKRNYHGIPNVKYSEKLRNSCQTPKAKTNLIVILTPVFTKTKEIWQYHHFLKNKRLSWWAKTDSSLQEASSLRAHWKKGNHKSEQADKSSPIHYDTVTSGYHTGLLTSST